MNQMDEKRRIAPRGYSVQAATEAIRDLITARKLLPGQQLRQDELAEMLGCSRGPAREALQALRQEGVVTHSKNRGYAVARFEFEELKQLYRLRELIEGEVLRSLARPTARQLARLRRLNEQLSQTEIVREIIRLNEDFHFGIFALSPLTIVLDDVHRMWKMAAAYRALSVMGPAMSTDIMSEVHAGMVDALERHDLEKLKERYRFYRAAALESLRAALH